MCVFQKGVVSTASAKDSIPPAEPVTTRAGGGGGQGVPHRPLFGYCCHLSRGTNQSCIVSSEEAGEKIEKIFTTLRVHSTRRVRKLELHRTARSNLARLRLLLLLRHWIQSGAHAPCLLFLCVRSDTTAAAAGWCVSCSPLRPNDRSYPTASAVL